MKKSVVLGIFAIILIISLTAACTRAKQSDDGPPQQAAAQESGPTGDNVVVIMFHDVSTNTYYPPFEHKAGRDPAIETPVELANQLAALVDNGYHVITLDRFHQFLAGQASVPTKAVLLTFDDGYEGVFKYVTSALAKENMTATTFMITGWWDDNAHMQAYWQYLTADQGKIMLSSGIWSFGGHTYNGHYEIPSGPDGNQTGYFYATREYLADQHRMETTDEYRERVLSDATKMTDELKKIGVTDPLDFAWPDGRPTLLAKDILIQLGYRYFYTQTAGVNKPDPSARTWDIYRVYPGNSPQSMLAAIREAEQ
ncbi:MAG TPA: polysaccharide deacetylase family protein [Spirochaetia bacterium]|nr:polysaccharide deacetylase family protein [Spirochaetia bacterium]